MRFGGEFKPINERFKTRAGARFRADTTLTAPILKEFGAGETVIANGRSNAGAESNGSTEWLTAWMYIGAYELGTFHSSGLEPFPFPEPVAPPAADCTALENKLAGARTAIAGAEQAVAAAKRSVAP